MTNIIEIPAENVAKEALDKIQTQLRTTEIASLQFIRPLTIESDGEDGGELAECILGITDDEDNHTVVSTYGLGGRETNTNITADGKEYNYHSEFYMIGANKVDAKLFADFLAQIAFLVSKTGKSLTPGSVLTAPDVETGGKLFFLFSDAPLGARKEYYAEPVFSDGFVVMFTNVMKLYEHEAELAQTAEGIKKLDEYFVSLGNSAYSYNRVPYGE